MRGQFFNTENEDGLIGVVLRPRRKITDVLDEAGPGAGLSPVTLSTDLADHPLGVFKVSGADEDSQVNTLKGLASVHRTGPIVRKTERSVSMLTRQIVIRFKEWDVPFIEDILFQNNLRFVRKLTYLKNGVLAQARTPRRKLIKISRDLTNHQRIIDVRPNLLTTHRRTDAPVPDENLDSEQWHLPQICVPEAWETLLGKFGEKKMYGGQEVIIAILDDGAPDDFCELSGVLTGGYDKQYSWFDFRTKYDPETQSLLPGSAGNAYTNVLHGQQAASAATAMINDKLGAGVAPNCRLMSLQVAEPMTDVDLSSQLCWAAGLDPAEIPTEFQPVVDSDTENYTDYLTESSEFPPPSSGADVISVSLVREEFNAENSDLLAKYLATYGCGKRGTIVVASAGNKFSEKTREGDLPYVLSSLARSETVLTVVACSREEKPIEGYVKDSVIDLCAPSNFPVGVSGGDSGHTEDFSGSSSATPLVAGVVALMRSGNPELKVSEIRDILTRTAEKIGTPEVVYDSSGHSPELGFGRVSACSAVAEVVADESVAVVTS